MGSFVELNDTLQITAAQGFPEEILDITRHFKRIITLDEVEGRIFHFKDKPAHRILHPPGNRNYFAQNFGGDAEQWAYWGEVTVLGAQWSESFPQTTSGTYKITKIYDPWYMVAKTWFETDLGKNYFLDGPGRQLLKLLPDEEQRALDVLLRLTQPF